MFVKSFSRASGFTLLEVLIAVLVFSIGLLGVAGMVLASMRGVHTAQLHTQAALQAQWIGDAMRANPVGVMAGNYNATAPAAVSQTCANGCTPAQAADRDMQLWGTQLASLLPAGAGSVDCDLNSPIRLGQPAFPAGLCTITLTWLESNETQSTGAVNGANVIARTPNSMIWVVNP
jgi:type IV pilus assembly protein PilV